MKFHTIQNPPLCHGEKFSKPTLTRESDYVSIEEIFAKYGMDSSLNPIAYLPIAQLSPEERDVLENSTPLDELQDEDITVQQEFINRTMNSVVSKKKEVKEPTQAEPEPEKPATKPENASN